MAARDTPVSIEKKTYVLSSLCIRTAKERKVGKKSMEKETKIILQAKELNVK